MLHRSSRPLLALAAGVALVLALGPAAAAPNADTDLAKNKSIVEGFWRDVLIARNIDAAPRYIRPDYVQHNPHEPQGLIGFQNFFREVFQHTPQGFKLEIVKTVAEGDLVVTYNHFSGTTPEGRQFDGNGFDMFRIQGGLIAEHWDQVEPEAAGGPAPPPGAAPAPGAPPPR